MKKFIVCLVAIVALLSFGSLTSVDAYPFIEVEGFANPTVATSIVDNGTTTTFSEVMYRFNVMTADLGALLNYVSLEFEGDVFASVGSLAFNNPADWTVSTVTSSAGNLYELMNAGTALDQGQNLTFTVSDVVVYNDALVPGNTLWQEGAAIWGQSWSADDTLRGGDGGSTALVPEPGTFLLFGAGIAGLFYVRRTKVFNV